nr:unnamed protein product [Callosobruchus analis]
MCEVLITRHILSEPKKIFKHMAMLATHIVGTLKFLLVITHQKELTKIKRMLQDDSLSYTCCSNCINSVQAAKSLSRKICLTTYFLYCMVGASAHLSALRNLNAAIKKNQFGGNVTCYDFLPYLFVIPFGKSTRNMRERIIQRLNLPKDFEAIGNDALAELENELHNELKVCNRNLELLLSACENIEKVFSYTILAQTIISLLVIASCMFAASLMAYTDPELYSLVEYAIASVFQLLMVCYFGNSITVAGETYRYSLYETDWYSSGKRFKQCLLIMMCRMEKPLYLTIGKFSPLTLQTFVAVSIFNIFLINNKSLCRTFMQQG